jgi:pantoate--beta-alanine ligase
MSEVRVIRTTAKLREELNPVRREGKTVGLVPTMGYLHAGHLSLIEAAREQTDCVVMSLFVNPAQFGDGEDLEAYPRDEARDLELAAKAGADVVFAPEVAEVYPDGFATYVEVEGLTDVLCGDPASRGADHFRGVTTVVAKLLNMAGPDFVFFGQKDAQQAIVIRRMVRDLNFPAEVVVRPTVREADGLAMSSRNAYLDSSERERAAALSRALRAAEAWHGEGVEKSLAAARAVLEEAGIEPEYLEARYADDLTSAQSFNGRPVLVAVAARVGNARLIDNVVVEAHSPAADK